MRRLERAVDSSGRGGLVPGLSEMLWPVGERGSGDIVTVVDAVLEILGGKAVAQLRCVEGAAVELDHVHRHEMSY